MAYNEYRGRSVGRLLCFLYDYTHNADIAIFHGPGADPMITLYNKPLANYTWDGETDIPTFEFLGNFRDLNAVQEVNKPRILECERLMNRQPWTPDEEKRKMGIRPEGWDFNRTTNRHYYWLPIRDDASLGDKVAEVWKRPDGRYNWRRMPAGWPQNKGKGWTEHKQGVCKTEQEAMDACFERAVQTSAPEA